MPKAVVKEEEGYRWDEGWYRARLESVVEQTTEFTYKAHHAAVTRGEAQVGEKGSFDKWVWNFTLLDDGSKIKADTDNWIGPSNSTARFYEAFLGRELEIGESVDTDPLEGRVAEIFIAQEAKRPGAARAYNRVTNARALINADSEQQTVYPPLDSTEPPF